MKSRKPQTIKLAEGTRLNKQTLAAIRNQIDATENGRIRVPGLGLLVVKTVEKEKEGHTLTSKIIRLRLSGTERLRRAAEAGAEPSQQPETQPPIEETL